MRSAFLLTHHIRSSSGFDFVDYLGRAMEDDFSHVVGLGLPMWIFIIIFVLLSSSIGSRLFLAPDHAMRSKVGGMLSVCNSCTWTLHLGYVGNCPR